MRKIFNLLFCIFLSACIPNNQPSSELMRRFTFAAFNALTDTTTFQSINSDEKVLQTLKTSGVVNYNFCTIDSISYLVLDMKESFNLEKTAILFDSLANHYPQLMIFSEIIDGKYQLLNRIYKLDQKKAYQATEGQLIPRHKDAYKRYVLTLEIINDSALARDYISVHNIGKAWPEITQNMKTVGIHEMELYLMGYRAFLIMDTKPDFDWDVDGKKWGELPREKEWQAYVAKFQKTNPKSNASEKWKSMQIISM